MSSLRYAGGNRIVDEDFADEEIRRYGEARKKIAKARAQRIFFAHLGAYIVGNVFLGSWNALTYFVKESQTLWFFLPLLFWGVGIIIHYMGSVALFDEWWELDERTIREKLGG